MASHAGLPRQPGRMVSSGSFAFRRTVAKLSLNGRLPTTCQHATWSASGCPLANARMADCPSGVEGGRPKRRRVTKSVASASVQGPRVNRANVLEKGEVGPGGSVIRLGECSEAVTIQRLCCEQA